jgi:hypothetical protein
MKVRQKSVLVRAAVMFEMHEALQMLNSRHETPAVLAERSGITAQLLGYKLELMMVARELEEKLSWKEFGDKLVGYVTKGTHGDEANRRERWMQTTALPIVAAVLVTEDYFEGMDTVSRVRLAHESEAVDRGWDLVVRFRTGHEYGVIVRRGSNEMRLQGATIRFGLPYRCMDGLKMRQASVHELDERLFNEIEGIRRVSKVPAVKA